jgi:hypothetical protein
MNRKSISAFIFMGVGANLAIAADGPTGVVLQPKTISEGASNMMLPLGASNVAVMGSSSITSALTAKGIAATNVSESEVLDGALSNYDAIVMSRFCSPSTGFVTEVTSFVENGGGFVGEWCGSTGVFSHVGPNPYGNYAITPSWGWFSGTVDHGNSVSKSSIHVIAPDHPVVAGIPSSFSAGEGTEFFFTSGGFGKELQVLAEYDGHSGTWPAVSVGKMGLGRVCLMLFDAQDNAGDPNLSQLIANCANWVADGVVGVCIAQLGVGGADTGTDRFTDNSDGTVTDTCTKLIWLKNASCDGPKNWDGAKAFASSLQNENCGLSDGSSAGDWRLPRIRELQSLIDYSQYNPALPSDHPFLDEQLNHYWSATSYTNAKTTHAWAVYFLDGDVVAGIDKNGIYYVWPVRSRH